LDDDSPFRALFFPLKKFGLARVISQAQAGTSNENMPRGCGMKQPDVKL
jgi:hypothetical protein